MPLLKLPDGRTIALPYNVMPGGAGPAPGAIEQAPYEGGSAPSTTNIQQPLPIQVTPTPSPAKPTAAPPTKAPAVQPREQQIADWLAYKASRYPVGTTPEQAAKWQAYDRARYEAFLGQKGGK